MVPIRIRAAKDLAKHKQYVAGKALIDTLEKAAQNPISLEQGRRLENILEDGALKDLRNLVKDRLVSEYKSTQAIQSLVYYGLRKDRDGAIGILRDWQKHLPTGVQESAEVRYALGVLEGADTARRQAELIRRHDDLGTFREELRRALKALKSE